MKECSVIYWSRTTPEAKKQLTMECVQSDELFDYYETTLNFSKVARYQKYYFLLKDNQGYQMYYSVNGFSTEEPEDGHFEYLYANGNDVVKVPEWAKGIIYYQIFPERFSDGDSSNNEPDTMAWGTIPTRENYMGGDLAGIHKQIPYLKDLGINQIQCMPIYDFDETTPYTNYWGYGEANCFAIKKRYAATKNPEKELKNMVKRKWHTLLHMVQWQLNRQLKTLVVYKMFHYLMLTT